MMKAKGLTITCVNSLRKDGALCRFPEDIADRLDHEIPCHMYGQEIRFRPSGTVCITLSCLEKFEENKVEIYYGDHLMPHEISFQDSITLEIKPLSEIVDQKLIDVFYREYSYCPDLVRIVLLGKRIRIDEVKGEFTDPLESDVPDKKILVYGTSLSQGTSTHVAGLNYPALLGRKLGMDVDNYSLAGQCLLEDHVVDWLSSLKEDYRLILFEPSTNLLAQGYSKEEFKNRVNYTLNRFQRSYPKALIVCIDLFESLFDHGYYGKFVLDSSPEEYRSAFEEIVKKQDGNILLVHAKDLLDRKDLSLDMMHPTTLGYYEIASRLYSILQERGL